MIQIYDSQNTDFEHNGDETLFPEECTVSAELNGTWVLNMTHPIDDEGRWKYIEEEAVIAVPTFMRKKQLFRIDRVSTVDQDDSEITAVAYPIFWDSGDDQFLTDSRPTDKNGQEALNIMLAGSKYSAESNITRTSTAYFERRNMMDALNGEDSPTFIQRWGGEILYDNYKVIVNERVGGDYGAEVRYRKNMDGIQCEISMENVVTRIVPVAYNGYTIGGNSGYVDSANIDKYAKVYTKEIRFEDVKMEEDAQEDDEENGTILCKSQEEMDQALTTRCEEQFSAGIDLPEVSIKVSVIDLENTEEYKDFSDLVKISLGDTVKCYNTKLDITTEARCIGMVWDCIRDTVDSVTLGDYQTNFIKQMTSTIERIASVFRNNGTLMADKISGVLDAMQTQLKCQQSVAKRMTVRAVLFEDLDENSPLYGAMAMGTQGLEISKTRTADGRGWDWTTAITASGIIASTIVAGILSDKTGRNWWNLETGDIQMSGRFQQYASNGVKSMDIFDNKINLYAWDDDGNYVGSLRSFLTTDKKRKGIELMGDAGDQVRLSVKRSDTATEEGRSVFIGENGYTGLFTVDGKGNAEEWLSRKHGGPVWIRNMPNGDFLAGGVRIRVESGLITSIPSNSVANGTFEVISGLSWANGGITSVDWVKVNVSNGAIKSWSTRTQNF